MQNLFSDIKRYIPDLKEAEIAGLLYIVSTSKSISTVELIRQTGLPKETLSKFKHTIGTLLNENPEEYQFNDEGLKAVKDLDLQPYDWTLITFDNSKLEKEFEAIRKQVDATISPKREYDQFYADAKTSISKATILNKKGQISGKKIALLGDDDLLSIAIPLVNPNFMELKTFDIDPELLQAIADQVSKKDFKNISTEIYNFKHSLPKKYFQHFDAVFLDPPYTADGVELFLNRAVQLLSKANDFSGKYIFLCYGNSFKSPEKFLQIQQVISKYNLVIEDVISKFNRYTGAESIGSASTLYILKTTLKTKPQDEENLNKDIYTTA